MVFVKQLSIAEYCSFFNTKENFNLAEREFKKTFTIRSLLLSRPSTMLHLFVTNTAWRNCIISQRVCRVLYGTQRSKVVWVAWRLSLPKFSALPPGDPARRLPQNILSLNASSYCIFDWENSSYTDGKPVYCKFLTIKGNESKRFRLNRRPLNLQYNHLPQNHITGNMKYSFQHFIFGKCFHEIIKYHILFLWI